MTKNEVQKAKVDTLRDLLELPSFQKSLANVLPKHMTPDKVVKLALVAASRQPKLYDCTHVSIMQALIQSAELGLDCTGTLGQGYLIPYGNQCQFIAGYQGLIELARRSGHIIKIEARVVYEEDQFEVEHGLEQKLIHKPYIKDKARGSIVYVYAIAELKEGSKQFDVMNIDEVNAIRDRSKASKNGPWVTDFSEMARKTVVRRLIKYLPKSPELMEAMRLDEQDFDFNGQAQKMANNMRSGTAGVKERLKHVDSTEVPPEEEPDPDQKAETEAEIAKMKQHDAEQQEKAEESEDA